EQMPIIIFLHAWYSIISLYEWIILSHKTTTDHY
ncbi:MAG: hypothetical protein ACI8RD_004986, partial [Bacillariaceae sp.]